MKKYLLTLATIALAGSALRAQSLPTEDGYCLISSAADMATFAAMVNAGQTTLNGKLTAAIDFADVQHTPIGSQANPFRGEFDGGLQPITNLNAMLFGSVDGPHITRIAIESGTVSPNGDYAACTGSIIGRTTSTNPGSLTQSYSKATVQGGGEDVGGLVGKFCGTIKDCLFAGTVSGNGTAGAIVGSSNEDAGPITATHCLVYMTEGVQSGGAKGAFIGWEHGTTTFTACYANEAAGALFGQAGGSNTDNHTLGSGDLASGKAAYMLNGYSSEDPVWFQTLDTDAYPMLTGDAIVYANGREHCDGTPYDGLTYSNTSGSLTRDEHNFVDGICQYCGTTLGDFVPLVDGWYEISSAGALEWFSNQVNTGNVGLKGRLTAPIDFSKVTHRPIGSQGNPFTGTFDGQFYAITNLNAMLFGTVTGAKLTRIAIESGSIAENTNYANATGSIVGWANANAGSSLTLSYSKATVATSQNDTGGLIGKFCGTIEDCFFAGSVTAVTSAGGIVGSSNEDSGPIKAKHCYAYMAQAVESTGQKGAFIGWEHGTTTFTACYANEAAGALFGQAGGTNSNCKTFSDDDFFSGAVAFALNEESFLNAAWRQTLGEDEYPVPMPDHGLVYRNAAGDYADVHDSGSLNEFRTAVLDIYREAVISTSLRQQWEEEAAKLNALSTLDEFLEGYAALLPLKASIDENAAAYSDFAALVEDTKTYYEENVEKLQGAHGDLLESYLVNEEAPSEDLPNGTAPYILANTKLSTSELRAEMDFLRLLLDNAIKYAGSIREITLMLKNPDLKEGDTGWDFLYGKTTGGAAGHGVYVREAWSTSFDMHQTLTGLQDGIYKLTVNAAFRLADDNTNLNHASFVYANDNQVYTMMDAEDAIPVDAAVDGVNCHLSEGEGLVDNNIYNAENEVIAYTPHGPEGYGYAFSAGRYANTIVCEVTDGVLTVGVRSPGWGGTQGTWLADFHLYYCGEKDQALSAIASSLEGQVERARTILEQYVPLTNENYASSPNFSQALKDELQEAVNAASAATDVDKMLSLTATFSKLFEQIFACKQAYTKYIAALETFEDAVYKYGTGLTEDDVINISRLNDHIWEKYVTGAYSLEDALYMEDLKSSSCYSLIYGTEPEIANGVVQLSSPWEVLWMARRVAEGEKLNAVVTAPIDFAGVPMIPIGTPSSPYSGEFDGQFYPLTNLSSMFFGTISGAKLTRIAVESGTVTGNTDFASATGSIVGWANAGSANSLTLSYSKATVSAASGDVGGLIGKFCGTIENCLFAGAVSGSGTAGGIVGSSNEDNGPVKAKHCLVCMEEAVSADGAKGAFIGWEHGTSSFTACYANEAAGALFGQAGGTNTNNHSIANDAVASGLAAYALNDHSSENPVWFQAIGTDAYPTFTGNAIVYANGREQCDGSPYDGTTYSNTPGSVVRDPHDIVNGICDICGAIVADNIPFVDGWYELSTPEMVEWFVYVVSRGHTELKGRLTAPIDFASVQHTPIGSQANPFRGEFDGGLQPITNLNAMLFGSVDGPHITRIAIESGTVSPNGDYAACTGSIIGRTTSTNPGSLTQSYSKATVKGGGEDVGGLIGKFCGTIKDCLFAGTVSGNGTAGAIVGSSNEDAGPITATHCLVYMTEGVQSGGAKGAFIGWEHGTTTFTACYANEAAGVLFGQAGGRNTENYTLENEQLASGQAAYMLNDNSTENPVWFQTLGEDLYPVLIASHGVVVKNDDGTFGNATGVEEIQTSAPASPKREGVYDLQGRKIVNGQLLRDNGQLPKGLYIINGKKVLVK